MRNERKTLRKREYAFVNFICRRKFCLKTTCVQWADKGYQCAYNFRISRDVCPVSSTIFQQDEKSFITNSFPYISPLIQWSTSKCDQQDPRPIQQFITCLFSLDPKERFLAETPWIFNSHGAYGRSGTRVLRCFGEECQVQWWMLLSVGPKKPVISGVIGAPISRGYV